MTREIVVRLIGEDVSLSKTASQAAGSLNRLAGQASQSGQSFGLFSSLTGKATSALGGMATVAGGMIAADIFGKLAGGVLAFAKGGLEAVGTAQKLETGLNALLTQNNMYEDTTETIRTFVEGQKDVGLQADKLRAKLDTQNAKLQEQRERVRQMTEEWTDEGLATQTAKARLAEMELQIRDTEAQLAGLNTSGGEWTETTKRTTKQVMNMGDAQKIAAKQSQELLAYVDKLAIVSPFEAAKVAQVTKYAVAAGLGVDSTKAFTSGFLDMAAAVGIGSNELDFAADQLLQVKKVGKLTTIDLRQLRRLGIDLEKIIGVQMGMSIEEFNKKAGDSPEIFDDLFKAVGDFSKNTFAGTSEKMATSVDGLKSTLSDIISISSKNLLRPLVDALGPSMSDALGFLSDLATGERVAKIGEGIAQTIMAGMSFLQGEDGMIKLIQGLTNLGFSADATVGVVNFIESVKEQFAGLKDAFEQGGFAGVGELLAGQLMDAWTNTIQPQLTIWGQQFWDWLTVTALPQAGQKLTSFGTQVGGLLAEQWTSVIQPKLAEWGQLFWDWTVDAIANAPTYLAGILGSVNTWLTEQWPTIQTELLAWKDKFWEWTQEAATNAATALGAIGVAILAWAQSEELQTQLNELGQNLGKLIVDGAGSFADDQSQTAAVVGKLLLGLGAAVVGIGGALITLGGQLVAGIISGILSKMGVDLEPATVSELSGILTGIAENIGEIASHLGKSIIDGIYEGIEKNKDKVWETLKGMAKEAILGVAKAIGYGSPAKKFIPFGESIVQGLVSGVSATAPQFHKVLLDAMNVQTRIITQGLGEGFAKRAKAFIGTLMGSRGIVDALNQGTLSASRLRDEAMALAASLHYPQSMVDRLIDFDGVAGDLVAKFAELQETLRIENALGGLQRASQFAGLGQTIINRMTQPITEEITGIEDKLRELGGKEFFFEDSVITVDRLNQEMERLVKKQALLRATGDDLNEKDLGRLDTIRGLLSDEQEYFDLQKKLTAEKEKQLEVEKKSRDIQKQQNDLNFLQQQLNIMKTLDDIGVNVKDVFGGITFGLDANLDDLLNATSTAIQAIIGQVNEDLQIASPSKVMAKVGKFMAQGLGMGFSGEARATGTSVTRTIYNQQTYNLSYQGLAPSPNVGLDLQTIMALTSNAA